MFLEHQINLGEHRDFLNNNNKKSQIFMHPKLKPVVYMVMVSDIPLTCQMFTIFSMAAAKYIPLTLQATGAKFGSPGDPRLFIHSSEVSSLKTGTENHKHHLSDTG